MTLEELERELAALPPPPQPMDDRDPHGVTRQALAARVAAARHAIDVLNDVEPQLARFTAWHDFLVTAREKLCTDLLAHAGPRDQLRNLLILSIRRVDRGLDLMNEMFPAELPLDVLMREAGYTPRDAVDRAHGGAWLGTLAYTEQRVHELTARRDDAQARLNAALREQEERAS